MKIIILFKKKLNREEDGKEDYYRTLTQAFKDTGLPMSAYFSIFIAEKYSRLYDEAYQNEYFVKWPDGK